MPSQYTLRMQFGPHEAPEEITEQLLKLAGDADMDELSLIISAEEQNNGHDTIEGIQQWLDRSRPYRVALKRAGVAVSLNHWSTLLHADRCRSLKPEQKWQRMVDPAGNQATAVVCPLDPSWRSNYFGTFRMYAREGFRVVWIDDDIRYHNHAPLQWGGCFCPLHVAEFNRRAGVQATREEIVAACLTPGEPHPWRAVWMDMWEETILEFLGQCRRILAAGGTRMGLMSSAMESHGAEGRRWEKWWQAFGGGQPPVHRPHFWTYGDTTGPHLIHGIMLLDQNRSIQPEGVESIPEIECWPHGTWSKSFRQTFAQMAVAHIAGSSGLNISLYDYMGNRPDDEPDRAEFLKRVRPNLDWLADRFPMTLKSAGVGVPWVEDMGRLIHLQKGKSWHELECPSRGWAHWLGAAGIAFSARPQESVNALAGPIVWSLEDSVLKQWLAGGILLDRVAATILVERGFGEWIGIKSVKSVTPDEVLYAIEECRDARFGLRVGGQMSLNDKAHARALLQAELAAGVEVVSDVRNPLQQVVGQGAFIFRNSLGGRVAVVPWDASGEGKALMDIHRATQLRRLVEWLGADHSMGAVDGGAWLVPQFLRDGTMWRGVVWNVSPDEVRAFRIQRPEGMPAVCEAWHLTASGKRRAVAFQGDVITLEEALHQWECVVIS